MFRTTSLIAACAATAAFSANAFIIDDFEVDSSANYTVVDTGSGTPLGDGSPDSAATFAFDYSTLGIPEAPNSAPGTFGGLRMQSNETGTDANPSDPITAFHNTVINQVAYTVTVDIYMEVDPLASGTTEFANIGVGSDASEFNSIFLPIAGDGQFLAMTGDGGSSSDYRHFVEGTPVNTGDLSYLNSDNTTNATGDTYQAIFPGGDFPGSPGNRWTTLTIDVNAQLVTYSLDGVPIIQTLREDASGFVSLGYADVFSSVGPHSVIYDNFSVIPEPASLALLAAGLGFAGLRRRSA
ncbi:MAG: PEP-CTERM sorting domain-containing protein [Planctomycetota bacterium]